jgi:hypothetical protein
MKHIGIALTFAALATTAQAQSRPDTRKMTCGQARSLVQARGAIVLSTSENAYDRYVSTQQSCTSEQTTVPAYVRTLDYTGCHVGYTCETVSRGRR